MEIQSFKLTIFAVCGNLIQIYPRIYQINLRFVQLQLIVLLELKNLFDLFDG